MIGFAGISRISRSALALANAAGLPMAAYAQSVVTSPAAAAVDGDIVVTAQKRSQSLQDVSVAISAVGAEGLMAIGRRDITAITSLIPSVQANQFNPTLTVFNIRGVSQNDFSDSQEAPIAFYNDEVYVAPLGAISGQNFDLERVEVLRGPQGTLFGRNATGGLIQVISAKPTETLEAFASLTLGSYSQVASEAALSGPITDGIRGRLSFTSNRNNGYNSNRIGPDTGDANLYGGRAQIEADVGTGGLLRLKGQLLRNVREAGGSYTFAAAIPNEDGLGVAIGPNEDPYDTCNGCNLFGYSEPDNSPFTGSFDHRGRFNRTYWTGTAFYTQEIGDITLTSITDYQRLRKNYSEDTDASPDDIFFYSTAQQSRQFSQELRLSGDQERFHWVAGAYFFNFDTRNQYRSTINFIPQDTPYATRTRTRSEAVFGQVEFPVTSTVSLVGGARYTWERKRLNYTISQNGVLITTLNPRDNPDFAEARFNNWSGKVGIDYKPNSDTLLYVSANRGTKGGGFGTVGTVPVDVSTIPFGQEVLTDYEGGFKLTLLDGKMRLNGAGFYYRYRGYQAFTVIETSQFITNNKARNKGIELELNGTAVPRLTYNLFGSYIDGKVYGLTLPSGVVRTRRLPQAPRWSAGGLLRYTVPAFGGELAAQTDWKWNSSQYFSAFNSPIDRQSAFAVGNVRLDYTPASAPIELAVFVENVTNKRYLQYSLDLSFLSFANQVYGRPRWFGGSATVRFN